MKGFKDKSGKFRPTENKNGVRMSRDQTVKTEGVRLARTKAISPEKKRKALLKIVDLMNKYDLTPNQIDNASIGEFDEEGEEEP